VWAINYHLQRRPANCRQRRGMVMGEIFGTDAQGSIPPAFIKRYCYRIARHSKLAYIILFRTDQFIGIIQYTNSLLGYQYGYD
jgi:hypothetical protein